MFTVKYNGRSCDEVGLKVAKRPNIPTPQKRITEIVIPGRSGALHIDEGAYEEIEIQIEFNFSENSGNWGAALRSVRKWMHGSGDGRLIFSDDEQYFYKVSAVQTDGDTERNVKRLGYLTVIFVCDPFMYSLAGEEAIDLPCTLTNDGECSMPVYKITGEGLCTLSVNGKSVSVNVGQEITIDTDLRLVFRGQAMENTAVTGDLSSLWLVTGENEIRITDGFAASVVPRWRYL